MIRREPKVKKGKSKGPPHMNEDTIIVTEGNQPIEVPLSCTPGAVGIIHPGVRDEVDPGAHLIEEKERTTVGVSMPWKDIDDIFQRTLLIMVSGEEPSFAEECGTSVW